MSFEGGCQSTQASGRCRRISAVPDRDRERRKWAVKRAFMHLMYAPRSPLNSLGSICGAKIFQTVRKLRGTLRAAQISRPTTAQSRKNRENWFSAQPYRSLASSFRTVCFNAALCYGREPYAVRGRSARMFERGHNRSFSRMVGISP